MFYYVTHVLDVRGVRVLRACAACVAGAPARTLERWDCVDGPYPALAGERCDLCRRTVPQDAPSVERRPRLYRVTVRRSGGLYDVLTCARDPDEVFDNVERWGPVEAVLRVVPFVRKELGCE